MMLQSWTYRITKWMVDILFITGIAALVALPIWSIYTLCTLGLSAGDVLFLFGVLFFSGIAALYLLWTIKVMLKTLLAGNPFTLANTYSLKKIAYSCLAIALIYLVKTVFQFTPATLVILLIFIIAFLFSMTLSNIFAQAVLYKEENDLTI